MGGEVWGKWGMEKWRGAVRVVKRIRGWLRDEGVIGRHRLRERDFTRRRTLCFERVVLLILQKTLRSVQLHLHDFFAALARGTAPATVSASAFTQARAKLKHTAFIELNAQTILEPLYAHPELLQFWQGHRVLAIDGSNLRLPATEALLKEFGGESQTINQKGARAQIIPQARLSVLYDCLNHLGLEARVGPYSQGERALACEHLAATRPGDLLVLDRGYDGYLLLAQMAAGGLDFVVRCTKRSYLEAAQLFARNETNCSGCITLKAKTRRAEAQAAGLPLEVTVRFVSLRLANGDLEVLVTSLLDEHRYPTEAFLALYDQRWKIETFYGGLKGRLDLENFSGLSREAILQDIHAAVFLSNLESVLTGPAQADLAPPAGVDWPAPEPKQVNRAVSFHALKSRVMDLLIGPQPIERVLGELTELFLANPHPQRPPRGRPRRPVNFSKLCNFLKRARKVVF